MKVKFKSIEKAFIFTVLFFICSFLLCKLIPNNAKVLIFYMEVSFVAVTFSWFAEQSSINNRKALFDLFIILSIGLLCAVFIYRDGTAIDDRHYRRMFYDVAKVSSIKYINSTFVEPAYVLILKIISRFTDKYLVVQIVTGLIPFFIIMAGLIRMKHRLNVALSVFAFITVFYFQMLSTNLSRMFFSIAIVFYCMEYLFEGRYKKYIIGVCIAALFHFSALFMLLFTYLARNKKMYEKRYYTTILYISIPLFFVVIARFIAPILGNRHSMYTVIHTINLFDAVVGCLDKLPFILVFWYFKQGFPQESQIKNSVNIAQYIYSFSLVLDFSSEIVNLGRLTYYTELMYIVGVSMLYKNIDSNLKKKALLILLITYGFLSMYTSQFNLVSHAEHLFPYKNIFFVVQ